MSLEKLKFRAHCASKRALTNGGLLVSGISCAMCALCSLDWREESFSEWPRWTRLRNQCLPRMWRRLTRRSFHGHCRVSPSLPSRLSQCSTRPRQSRDRDPASAKSSNRRFTPAPPNPASSLTLVERSSTFQYHLNLTLLQPVAPKASWNVHGNGRPKECFVQTGHIWLRNDFL